MLYGLFGFSLFAVLSSVLLHVASFTIAVNENALHVVSFVLMLALCIGSTMAVPRDQKIETEGEVAVKSSILRHVPLWLWVPIYALGLYAIVGLYVQVGVRRFSILDMSPTLARWACVFEAVFFQVAAVQFYAAAKLRRLAP